MGSGSCHQLSRRHVGLQEVGQDRKVRQDLVVGQDLAVGHHLVWVVWITEVWQIMDHLEVARIQPWVVWIMEVWQIMDHLEVVRIQPWGVWIMEVWGIMGPLMEEWEVWEIMENENVSYKVETLLNCNDMILIQIY